MLGLGDFVSQFLFLFYENGRGEVVYPEKEPFQLSLIVFSSVFRLDGYK
jgi:hypothetical protein